ncbi:MAG: hypothetical protein ACRDHE_11385, partial [Ktedonobacterales bacterium]
LGQERSGVASGVNNAASRTAGLLAIAIMNLVVVAVFSHAFDTRIAALHLSPALNHALAAQRTRLAAAHAPGGTSAGSQAAIQHAVALSFVASFRVAMLIGAALALASSVAAALFIEGKGVGEALRALRPAHSRPQAATRRVDRDAPRLHTSNEVHQTTVNTTILHRQFAHSAV